MSSQGDAMFTLVLDVNAYGVDWIKMLNTLLSYSAASSVILPDFLLSFPLSAINLSMSFVIFDFSCSFSLSASSSVCFAFSTEMRYSMSVLISAFLGLDLFSFLEAWTCLVLPVQRVTTWLLLSFSLTLSVSSFDLKKNRLGHDLCLLRYILHILWSNEMLLNGSAWDSSLNLGLIQFVSRTDCCVSVWLEGQLVVCTN